MESTPRRRGSVPEGALVTCKSLKIKLVGKLGYGSFFPPSIARDVGTPRPPSRFRSFAPSKRFPLLAHYRVRGLLLRLMARLETPGIGILIWVLATTRAET